MEEIEGFVEAIVYSHPENGFSVLRLKEKGKKELTTLVGPLASVQPGESISCQGSWKFHPAHGRQFEVAEFTLKMPSDVVGIQKYLESGLIKGIGPVFAQRIVERFGAGTLDIIEQTPKRLLEIDGLGTKKLKAITTCWAEQKTVREVMIFLRAHGASPALAQKIFRHYGAESISRVKNHPYALAQHITGIGFRIADTIAQKLGLSLHSSPRIRAGIEFVLSELASEGHTCFPYLQLLPLAEKILEVPTLLLEREIESLIQDHTLVRHEELVWLSFLFTYEEEIAKELSRLSARSQAVRTIRIDKAIEWVSNLFKMEFAPQQQEAIEQTLFNKVHIITGGPGTGKSTITKAILAIYEKLTRSIVLAAPTGRAAKRMAQITRHPASTIHSLLEVDFVHGGFKKHRQDPLQADFIIVDEASMIDTFLFFSLLKATPDHAKLLLIGDVDQLPSVGPGSILGDLIASNKVQVSRLTEIFRQAKGSRIITNAHRINQGEIPSLQNDETSDFHFIHIEEPEAIHDAIIRLVSETIPQKWHYDRIDDVQVLSPMKKGIVGAENLNHKLQEVLNPSTQPLFRAGHRFHVRDKIMQIRNDYDKHVYNGDIGRIVNIDVIEQMVLLSFDGREVEYRFDELDTITLAYATSVHKYQGSECPCIVMPVHTTHFKLLQKNLLYTAVTRGRKLVYLVGSKKAVAIAVQNDHALKRHTGLCRALKQDALLPEAL
jgi:exodeoxyribonuclease V alpha subunit